MATPQELYDETKTRLDLNIAKLQMLQEEISKRESLETRVAALEAA
jgi:hypothetical protein